MTYSSSSHHVVVELQLVTLSHLFLLKIILISYFVQTHLLLFKLIKMCCLVRTAGLKVVFTHGVIHVTAPGMHTCGSAMHPAASCSGIGLLKRGVLQHIS